MLSAFFARRSAENAKAAATEGFLSQQVRITPQARDSFTIQRSDYALLKHIAQGSAAKIDLVRHRSSGRVAVMRTQNKRQRSLKMLKNEADLAFQLSHKNVC
jgi:hypothetical protein